MTELEFQQRQDEQLRIHRIDRLLDAVQTLAPEISLKFSPNSLCRKF